MIVSERQTIDTRTPLQKVRRTTLFRFLTMSGVECSDNDTAEKLRTMVMDEKLGEPDVLKVNEAWAKFRAKEAPKEEKKEEPKKEETKTLKLDKKEVKPNESNAS